MELFSPEIIWQASSNLNWFHFISLPYGNREKQEFNYIAAVVTVSINTLWKHKDKKQVPTLVRGFV